MVWLRLAGMQLGAVARQDCELVAIWRSSRVGLRLSSRPEIRVCLPVTEEYIHLEFVSDATHSANQPQRPVRRIRNVRL